MYLNKSIKPRLAYYLVYSLLISMPLLVAVLFGFYDFKTSTLGNQSLLKYNHQALVIVLVAVVTISFVALFLPLSNRTSNHPQTFFLNKYEFIVYACISLISYIGLLKSFSGFIFQTSYKGPQYTWLGVGAWSLIFLFTFQILLTTYFDIRKTPYQRLGVIFITFSPILLCGSRIDFISSIIFEACAFLLLSPLLFKEKAKYFLILIISITTLGSAIGSLRYTNEQNVPLRTQGNYLKDAYKNNVIYLSTIGDLGTSVYQAIDFTNANPNNICNLTTLAHNYAIRMLPGFLFKDRPIDLWADSGFGGGALHSLGEGFLFSGLPGVVLICSIFGVIIHVSYQSKNAYVKSNSPISWLMFAFPWLLIVRSGWYQFFSLLKGLEILAILLLISYFFRFIKRGLRNF